MDSEDERVEEYLAKFKAVLTERLATAIDNHLQNDPDCVKGRKKTVQVSSKFQLNLLLNITHVTCNLCCSCLSIGDIPRALHTFDVPSGAPANGQLIASWS